MAKIMELVLQANTPTGLWINKYNLINTSLAGSTNAALNIIESLGYQSGTPGTPAANSVFLRYLQTTYAQFEFTQFYCRDLYNVGDFAQVAVAGVGWQGTRAPANFEAAWTACKLKSSRTRQDIKAGYKALPPMLEADSVSAIGTIEAAHLARMQALASTLANGTSPFVGPVQHAFVWAILGKEKYVTPSGKEAYRYYATEAEQMEHAAYPVSWVPVERITTQDTRKFGRGR